MDRVENFISKCKEPVKQRDYRPLTEEEIETKREILEYILSNRNEVQYTERVYNKLQNILNDLLIGGK